MKRSKLLALLMAIMLVAVSVLTGCGSKENAKSDDKGAATGDKLDADQTLNMIGYDYSSLDPAAESDVESGTTFRQVYEGLMTEVIKDGVDTAELAGASDMKVSDDGLVYTFTLRDAKWSDGQPVKAQDYVFGWKRLIDPDEAHDYMHFIDCVKNVPEFIDKKVKFEDVGIKAKDDKTFEVTLSKPIPSFKNMLIFSGLVPQREDIYTKLGKDYGVDYTKMVYNGPFTVGEYQKNSKIVFTKNANYWDAANVKLAKAVCPIVEEPTTIYQMFQAKELDQMGASTADLMDQLKTLSDGSNGTIQHITGVLPSVFYYVFNCQHPITKNAKVRQALSIAYDRTEYLSVLYKRNVEAYGMVPGGLMVGDKDYRKVTEEPLKKLIADNKDPKALLMEGLKEEGITDPSKVKLTFLSGKATTASKQRAEYIQKVWQEKLGITINIKYAVDSPSYFTDRTAGNFDICTGGWSADFNDVYSMLEYMRTGNGNNNGKYSNPEYDKAVNDALSEADPAKRLEDFQKAEKIIIADDAAVAPYFYQDIQSYRYSYVKGLVIPLFGAYYDLKTTYISGKQ